MLKRVKCYLATLGYQDDGLNDELIKLCIDMAAEEICNFCNLDRVPKGLYYTWMQRSAGKFLGTKYWNGGFTETDAPAESVTVGDVKVDFAADDPSTKKFSDLAKDLSNAGESEMLRYRKLAW